MNSVLIMLILVLVSIGIILAGGDWNPDQSIPPDFCMKASDCLPARCCHPESAVNRLFAPDCSEIGCTAVCSGPLDCGRGRIECISEKCVIVPV